MQGRILFYIVPPPPFRLTEVNHKIQNKGGDLRKVPSVPNLRPVPFLLARDLYGTSQHGGQEDLGLCRYLPGQTWKGWEGRHHREVLHLYGITQQVKITQDVQTIARRLQKWDVQTSPSTRLHLGG